MDTTKNIDQVRDEIAGKKKARHHLAEQIPLLGAQCREISNWLRGHETRSDADGFRLAEGEEKRVSRAIEEKKAELAALREKIAGIEREIKLVDADLAELAAMMFGADEVMAQALRDYRDAQGRGLALQENEQALRTEKERADAALIQAKAELAAAQTKKSKALSVADVDEAGRVVTEAQQRVSNTEILLGNLDHALGGLGNKKSEAQACVAEYESAVWKAHCALIVAELKTTPEFSHVAAKLEDAFAASVSAGNFADFGRFMSHVFLGEGNLTPDHEIIAARKEDARRALHLAEAST